MSIFDWGRGRVPPSGDRRADEWRRARDRRSRAGEYNGSDRRQADRRRLGDRRGWTTGVIYKTTQPVAGLEDWLAANCAGDWGLTLQDVSDDFTQKSYLVLFEREADKAKFIDWVSRA